MIEIKNPKVEVVGGKCRLSAPIIVDKKYRELWLEVDSEWGDYLCEERCDAFVVALLHYAYTKGYDIVTETPITSELHYNITRTLIPALVKANPGKIHQTIISAPLAPPVEKIGLRAVGTGVSCGVDSLHVINEHSKSCLHEDFMVTHLMIANLHGVTLDDSSDHKAAIDRALKKRAAAFAVEEGYELIEVETNFDRECYEDLLFDGAVAFGISFLVLGLQKLWSVYLIGAGFDFDDFSLENANANSSSYYDYLTLNSFTTGATRLVAAGFEASRLDKVKNLATYPPSYKYLNVCQLLWNEDHDNCSYRCPKCMRTMLALDAIEMLDKYRAVFDVDYYRTHLEQYVAELYRLCLRRHPYGMELKEYFSKVSISVKLKAFFIVFKKMVYKVLRFGRVSQNFSAR